MPNNRNNVKERAKTDACCSLDGHHLSLNHIACNSCLCCQRECMGRQWDVVRLGRNHATRPFTVERRDVLHAATRGASDTPPQLTQRTDSPCCNGMLQLLQAG